MNMRDADVRTVIQWMSETTGHSFIVDPSVQGNITVLSSQSLSAEQAFDVFLQALNLNGFSASIKGNTVSIVPSAKSSQNHSAVLDSFEGHSGGEKAVHVFQARSINAAAVATQLQPLLGEHGTLSHLQGTNTLLIADRVDNIRKVRSLIDRLDQRGQLDIDIITLRHTDAEQTERALQNLLGQSDKQDLALAIDQRSNSLLVSGSEQMRQQVRSLVTQLDRNQTRDSRTEVVYLSFINAEEMLPVLESMHSREEAGNAHTSVQAVISSNALVLTASNPILEQMKSVIADIDVERRQVHLEAVIVEVSDQLIDSLGVQWQTAFNGRDVEAASNFGLEQVERVVDANGDILSENSVLGRGFTLGYYRNGSLRGLLNALSQTDQANLLSTPSVVALDNEQAEILVGSNVPVISGQQTSQASSTNDPFTTIERRDIGVSLQVTPQINEQGTITLDILQQVESISNSTVASDLIFDKRSIKTKVLVDDDEVLVLGGLTREDKREGVERVPVLGYIPILGRLFQRSTDESVRSNLMVFVHPRILDKQTARSLSRERYDQLRKKQTEQKKTTLSKKASPLLENVNLDQ